MRFNNLTTKKLLEIAGVDVTKGKAKQLVETKTATGDYDINGDVVTADNSGYTQIFSKREIQQGLKTGKFTDKDGTTWDVEVNPHAYGLSGPDHFVVETGDVMYEFRLVDFK